MSFFLGIDLGTSYFKAGVFDREGKLRGLGRQPVVKSGAAVGRCELTPARFRRTLRLAIAQALSEAGTRAERIGALSWSSQANSFILLDASDEPLTPLILWPDGRGTDAPEALTGRTDFMDATGLGIAPGGGSMISKTERFRHRQPRLWDRTRSIMTISDYLAFGLTGHRVGEWGTASMTGLFDVARRGWWDEALGICGIARERLSVPLETGTCAGRISVSGARLTGLSAGTALFAGGLDHHIAAVGAGATCRNHISESTGTVLACVGYKDVYEPRRGVNTAPGLDRGHYFSMAFEGNGAAALEWYRRNHAAGMSMVELLELAAKVETGCGGLTARPCADRYAALEGFENIRPHHSEGHFARAILESTARSLSQLVLSLEGGGSPAEAVVPTGGGARSRLWLQIKADLLGREFLVPESGELACKGAAMLCAVGTSHFGSIEEAAAEWTGFKEKITPHGA